MLVSQNYVKFRMAGYSTIQQGHFSGNWRPILANPILGGRAKSGFSGSGQTNFDGTSENANLRVLTPVGVFQIFFKKNFSPN